MNYLHNSAEAKGKRIWSVQNNFLTQVSVSWSAESLKHLLGNERVEDEYEHYSALLDRGNSLGEFESCGTFMAVSEMERPEKMHGTKYQLSCQFSDGEAIVVFGALPLGESIENIFFDLEKSITSD